MKTTKNFLFVIVMAAMVLSACGGTPATTAVQPTQAEVTGAAQPTTSEPVHLVFWSMWNEPEPQAVALQTLMDSFTALHPNITFEVVWNGRENQTKLRTALAAGTQVDFMDQDSDQLAGGMMSEGLGYALDDWLTQNALDQNVPITDVFSPGVLEQYKTSDGHTYLWSYMSSPVMFWYNKDIFTQAGVTQPPATWDEFLTTCDKIKAIGIAPITTESNEAEYDNYWFNYLVERQKGPEFLANTIIDKTGAMWTDPVYATTITMIQDLWTRGCIPEVAKGYMWPAGQQMLATDLAGMELCGAWLPNELKSSARPDFNWGGFPFPSIAGGLGNGGDITIWTGSMMILNSSAHPQEAFEFLKYVMTNDNQATISTDAIQGVPNINVTWPAAIADGAAAANNANMVILSVGGGLAFHPEFIKSVLNINLSQAFFGKITPDEFSTRMAADAAAYWLTHTK
jgi:ABC-type glycerol-3-phosphate transport system substrate-binding protein